MTEPAEQPEGQGPTGRWSGAKQVFRRGLAALLPTLLTLVIFFKAFQFLGDNVGYWISRGLADFWQWVFGYRVTESSWEGTLLIVAGLFLAASGVFILGYLASTVVGRWVYSVVDGWLSKLPMVRQVYPSVKQVTHFLLREQTLRFTQVVAVPYPRPGVYTLGFITGSSFGQVDRATGRHLVSVFMPHSPAPVSGYTALFPEEEIVYLAIPVEEGLRFVMSAGVALPGSLPVAPPSAGPPALRGGEGSATSGREGPPPSS